MDSAIPNINKTKYSHTNHQLRPFQSNEPSDIMSNATKRSRIAIVSTPHHLEHIKKAHRDYFAVPQQPNLEIQEIDEVEEEQISKKPMNSAAKNLMGADSGLNQASFATEKKKTLKELEIEKKQTGGFNVTKSMLRKEEIDQHNEKELQKKYTFSEKKESVIKKNKRNQERQTQINKQKLPLLLQNLFNTKMKQSFELIKAQPKLLQANKTIKKTVSNLYLNERNPEDFVIAIDQRLIGKIARQYISAQATPKSNYSNKHKPESQGFKGRQNIPILNKLLLVQGSTFFENHYRSKVREDNIRISKIFSILNQSAQN